MSDNRLKELREALVTAKKHGRYADISFAIGIACFLLLIVKPVNGVLLCGILAMANACFENYLAVKVSQRVLNKGNDNE